jgi:opacity protein-like surface antigen
MKRNLLAALLGVALLLPVAAHAEGSYLKLGVGQSQYEGDVAEYQYFEKFNDVRASAFTFGLTYRF